MNELTHFMPLLLRRSAHKPTLRVSHIAFPDGTVQHMNTITVDGTKWTGAGADPERLLRALLTGNRHEVRIEYPDFVVEFEAVKR